MRYGAIPAFEVRRLIRPATSVVGLRGSARSSVECRDEQRAQARALVLGFGLEMKQVVAIPPLAGLCGEAIG